MDPLAFSWKSRWRISNKNCLQSSESQKQFTRFLTWEVTWGYFFLTMIIIFSFVWIIQYNFKIIIHHLPQQWMETNIDIVKIQRL